MVCRQLLGCGEVRGGGALWKEARERESLDPLSSGRDG